VTSNRRGGRVRRTAGSGRRLRFGYRVTGVIMSDGFDPVEGVDYVELIRIAMASRPGSDVRFEVVGLVVLVLAAVSEADGLGAGHEFDRADSLDPLGAEMILGPEGRAVGRPERGVIHLLAIRLTNSMCSALR
jgi:hypothetical protein